MSKVFKDEKIFNKFKSDFRFIFRDKNFIDLTKNHFNKNGSFAVFTLAFFQNRLGENKILTSARINASDWLELFNILYSDSSIIKACEKLNLNPVVDISSITKTFDCFDNFIDHLFRYVKEQEWSLNIANNDLRKLLSSAYGYLLYNSIECKLNNQLTDIVEDPQYDKKYQIILNNTKLFAKAKNYIREYCEEKINDLIVILLGGSNHLALDK